MNQHLTSEQLDALLIGDQDQLAATHLKSCAQCAAEVQNLRSSIALFSNAITDKAREERFRYNTQTSLLRFNAKPARNPFRTMFATFALAASVAIVAVVVPVTHTAPAPAVNTPVATVKPAQPAETDEALLTEIDQQLSASVPEALAPLENPNGTTSTSTQK